MPCAPLSGWSDAIRECWDQYAKEYVPVTAFWPRMFLKDDCQGERYELGEVTIIDDIEIKPGVWKEELAMRQNSIAEQMVGVLNEKVRETTELLVRKEERIGQLETERDVLANHAAAWQEILENERIRGAHLSMALDRTHKVCGHWVESAQKLGTLVDTLHKIVLDLFDKTSDRAVYNQCKVALEAYEEAKRDAAERTRKVYGAPAVEAGAEDGRDRSAPGPAGVCGGEPAGQAQAGVGDGACSLPCLKYFDGIPQSLLSIGDSVQWSRRELKAGRTFALREKHLEAASLDQLIDEIKDFAEGLHHGCERYKLGIFWRMHPEYWSVKDHDTGKVTWKFHCKYFTAPKVNVVAHQQQSK